ncbi:FCD domain-containing protein [Gordonia sp. KTR9]|uniref:FCD domain-containing protein n=1 Tax=Gordonia sp. KTR9 TaxID=337191 RepID=UPI0002DB4A67
MAALRAWGGRADDLDVLSGLVVEAADTIDNAPQFAKVDSRIHQAITDLSGTQTLSVVAGMILNVMDEHKSLHLSVHGDDHERDTDELALRAYRRLLKLLTAGDVDGAVAHWRRFLRKIEPLVIADPDTTLVEVLP